MDRRAMALECVRIEKKGGNVLQFLRSSGCISPWGTWYRLQKEELQRKDSQIRDGKGKEMKKVNEDIKKKAVEIAINGGDPRGLLRDNGSKNADALWLKIKDELRKTDPETWEKIPKGRRSRQKREEEPKDDEEGHMATVKESKRLPEEAATGLQVTAAKGLAGEWKTSGGCITLTVERNGRDVIAATMTEMEWRAAMMEMPAVLKMLGYEE